MVRRRNFINFTKSILLTLVFVVILVAGVNANFNQLYLPGVWGYMINVGLSPLSLVNIDQPMAGSLIRDVNIALAGQESNSWIPSNYLKETLPEAMMMANIQTMASTGSSANANPITVTDQVSEPALPVTNQAEQSLNTDSDYFKTFKGCVVKFYCTHSGETYIPDSSSARVEGKRGLVNNVAAHLGQTLKQKGLDADYIDTIHDYPDFNASYTNSRNTVKNILAEKDKRLLAIFDVHRDSIPGLSHAETVKINNKEAAQVLIIVGTNERKPNSYAQQNLSFAQKLYNKGEQLYPGLIKGARTKAGTYNQEFFNHSLLLEFGADNNNLAQCIYSSELFANVLLEVLKEEAK